MYTRCFRPQDHSFFLFGPRGTGKTTWLREHYADAIWFNLLTDADFVPLVGDPTIFRKQVLARKTGWVVIDEVQKIPSLLNEVQDLISLHGKKYRFALSGSSARKLRKMEANLLAGRALDKRFFPLTKKELGTDFDLTRVLSLGCLPAVYSDPALAPELLEAYIGTYLREEIQQEAIVQNLESFSRFLRVAAIMNGNVLEYSSVARDCGVARKTVERYFQVLIDTLVAFMLPAWQPRIKVREPVKPKFYLFDTGVTRALAGRARVPLHDLEKGLLLETYVLHELRAAIVYLNVGGELSHYRSSHNESDVIYSLGDRHVAFEIKSGTSWRREYGSTLKKLIAEKQVSNAFGVYRGDRELKDGTITVLPVAEFLDRLWAREIF